MANASHMQMAGSLGDMHLLFGVEEAGDGKVTK